MPKKDYIPLLMGFSLIAGIVALAAVRYVRAAGVWRGYPVDFDTVFVALYILWLIVELRVSRRDADTEGKKTADSATCQIYGMAQAFTILSALWFPSVWQTPAAAHAAGIVIFLGGVGYRLWAVRTLGEFYSHRVRTTDGHRIVDSGPYRFLRHPAYAGMVAANIGVALYFLNAATACVFLFALIPSIAARIAVEERTLFRIEGYAEFAKTRKRLLPGVW